MNIQIQQLRQENIKSQFIREGLLKARDAVDKELLLLENNMKNQISKIQELEQADKLKKDEEEKNKCKEEAVSEAKKKEEKPKKNVVK